MMSVNGRCSGAVLVWVWAVVGVVVGAAESVALASPAFVLVSVDGKSLLTAELQGSQAVIINTQPLSGIGGSFFPVITYADDVANPLDVYALRNDQAAIIQADAGNGTWTDGGYGVLTGGTFDDIAYDGGQGQLYGTASGGGSLWKINGPSSITQVGGFGGAFQEIAIDETTGQMYGTNLDGNRLYAINKADATWTEIAAFSAQGTAAPGAFTDLTFTLDGQLYGMTTTAIYEIDKATAVYNPTMFPIVDSGSTPVTVGGHFAAVPVPEPSAVVLLAAAGCLGAAACIRRRRTVRLWRVRELR
jgi:hypothetical protein